MTVRIVDVKEPLGFALCVLESEAKQLRQWAIESERGGWSTHQVEPMRRRADEIDGIIYELRKER